MKLKGNNYLCPHCKGQLRANNKIILSAKLENGDVGLLLLDPELGNYKIIKHSSFKVNEGEKIDLYCTICHENLEAKGYDGHLARVIMIDTNNKEFDILFSNVAGEECTYLLDDGIFEAYGVDSGQYTNFFGETPKY